MGVPFQDIFLPLQGPHGWCHVGLGGRGAPHSPDPGGHEHRWLQYLAPAAEVSPGGTEETLGYDPHTCGRCGWAVDFQGPLLGCGCLGRGGCTCVTVRTAGDGLQCTCCPHGGECLRSKPSGVCGPSPSDSGDALSRASLGHMWWGSWVCSALGSLEPLPDPPSPHLQLAGGCGARPGCPRGVRPGASRSGAEAQ